MIVGGRIGQAPYSIEDLWVRVKAKFAADSDLSVVEFRHGHQSLEEWDGVNRIILVQDDPELSFGSTRAGDKAIGTLTDACRAHVWGVTPGKDYRGPDQGIAAKSLIIEFAAAAYLEFAGMVRGGVVQIATSTQTLKYGEACILNIRLLCPIEIVTPERALRVGGAETRV